MHGRSGPLLQRQSDAGIADRHEKLFALGPIRADGELAHAVLVLHRINAMPFIMRFISTCCSCTRSVHIGKSCRATDRSSLPASCFMGWFAPIRFSASAVS